MYSMYCILCSVFGWFCILFPPQALGTLKQKVRKYNKDFEKDIQSYRENPVTSDAEQASKLYLLNIACSIYMYLVITTQLKFIVGFLCKIKITKTGDKHMLNTCSAQHFKTRLRFYAFTIVVLIIMTS